MLDSGGGGHEDADRLDRAGVRVHEPRQDSTEALASVSWGMVQAQIVIVLLLRAVTWFRGDFVVKKC